MYERVPTIDFDSTTAPLDTPRFELRVLEPDVEVGAAAARFAQPGAISQSRPDVAASLARATKRALDIVGSTLGLVLLFPLLLAIGAAIRLDSPGPALFVQRRLGKDGAPFSFYKFRSMTNGCSSAAHRAYVTELIQSGSSDLKGSAGSYKLEGDQRVTRIGRMLRRTSLDELPQLWNVFRGDMSLVGPRPPLEYEVEVYSPYHMRRLEALPGMTGLWQVSGRTTTTFERMVDLDIEYIDNWSLRLDVDILRRTASVVTRRVGAW